MKKDAVDELDRKIVAKLQEDARRSYREIASELGVSVGTVHNRIKKMLSHGVLKGFFPLLNPRSFGLNLMFVIQVRITGGEHAAVFEKLKDHPSVRSIYHVTGETSAILICDFLDVDDTRKFLYELNQDPNVERTVSSLVLERVKENPSFQVRGVEGREGKGKRKIGAEWGVV